MDSCRAMLKTNAYLTEIRKRRINNDSNGFWGERFRGSLKARALSAEFSKNLRTKNRVRKVKTPGVAFSILIHLIYMSTLLTFQPPIFDDRKADPKSVASIILGGGAGTRLFPLTSRRAKPAVPVGGCYRLIDVPISNYINSVIRRIFILTQFNSFSLNRHLAHTYNFGNGVNFGDGFVEVLAAAAAQTPGEAGNRWFYGSANAVRQFIWVFENVKNKDIEHILIPYGDHLYRIDYMDFERIGRAVNISTKPSFFCWIFPKHLEWGLHPAVTVPCCTSIHELH
ncbi:Nucleotidyl transferase domain [Dillenia turbinata]|uniref:glucose-1-phosphate adenylyltransferase n=1 Tax=Dillenia turbinata TaxID=194707 RepID=A0AAN8VXL5_9MAGN